MRTVLEWAQVRALRADGLSQREIAQRLGVNRRTVARLLASGEPPRYQRAPAGSRLDPLEPVLRRLLEEWPQIKAPRATEILRKEYGYSGSVRLVRLHLRRLRPPALRPAQRTGYRPGQVLQLDWTEMPTRPTLAGRERRPLDGYLRHGRCFYRAPGRLVHERVELRCDRDAVRISHHGAEVARYPRSYEEGIWLPPPIMRPEPPIALPAARLAALAVCPPELSDYAELCA